MTPPYTQNSKWTKRSSQMLRQIHFQVSTIQICYLSHSSLGILSFTVSYHCLPFLGLLDWWNILHLQAVTFSRSLHFPLSAASFPIIHFSMWLLRNPIPVECCHIPDVAVDGISASSSGYNSAISLNSRAFAILNVCFRVSNSALPLQSFLQDFVGGQAINTLVDWHNDGLGHYFCGDLMEHNIYIFSRQQKSNSVL